MTNINISSQRNNNNLCVNSKSDLSLYSSAVYCHELNIVLGAMQKVVKAAGD